MPDPYDASANPDFLSALVAYWLSKPALVAISRAPYAEEASFGVEPPYCVLTIPRTIKISQDTRRNRHVQSMVQFAIFDRDQDVAADLGQRMIALLEDVHDHKPQFANGYLMAWDWTDENLMEVPEVGKPNTIWRQTHIYTADVIFTRARV